MSNEIFFDGEFIPSQEKEYVHFPFDVPSHTTRIEVEYRYSQQIDSDPLLSGGNTLDLGIFDERGIHFLHAGFRGWSGSERRNIFIGETEATPGYLAGAIHAGQWHVLLGLYKIAPEGCNYRVTITLTTENKNTARAQIANLPTNLPSSQVPHPHDKWLRGEMHCHTVHSDGDSDPQDLVRFARERGLDFLAVTDHNTTSHQRALETFSDPGMILIRGVEVTTFKGHLNVWGIPNWIDFRVTHPEQMRAAVQSAKGLGALTSCNHPKPFGPMWDYAEVEDYSCIEVWNGPWQDRNQDALDFWTERLAQGKRFVAVGGSDWHHFRELEEIPPRAPGTPTMWVYVDQTPSADAILEAIRCGHVSLSDEPDGPFLELCAGAELSALMGGVLNGDKELFVQVRCLRGEGCTLRLLDQNEILCTERIAQSDQVVNTRLEIRNSLLVRAELRDADDNMKALTNPIYLEIPKDLEG